MAAPETGPLEVLVFVSCGPEFLPVLRRVRDAGEAPEQALAELVARGVTAEEESWGYSGGLRPVPVVATVRRGDRVTVDLDVAPEELERFLAGSFFFTESLERTFSAYDSDVAVEVTLGGRSLCEVSDECSG